MIPFKGAIAGFGFIAEHGHLPAYRERSDLFAIVAVADICEARRELARRLIPGVRVYERVSALLEAEADRLDFLDIATPPCDHASITHAALDHGLHVFCEKPIATSAEDARSLLEHATAARRVFFPSHNYRHAPVVRTVRKILDEGNIGNLHLVTLNTFRTKHAVGVADWKPDWRRMHRYSGGGIAMDHGSHSFYLAFDWLRSYPTSITAHMEHHGGHDTEDGFSCTASFPTGTAIAHLTWNAGVRKVIYSLHGERGAITIEDDDIQIAIGGKVEHISASSHWMDASHAAWFTSLLNEFVDAIRTGEHVGKSALDAFHSVQLIQTAYASSRASSHMIALPPAHASPAHRLERAVATG